MYKVAIFVEGLTEKVFIKKLIGKRYGNSPYRLIESRLVKWEYLLLQPLEASTVLACEFIIIEVPSYDLLFSYVIENAPDMIHRHKYDFIVGLRDLHPAKRDEEATIMKLNSRLLEVIPDRDKIALILAIMQTEAWFLCDHTLFQRINSTLTPDYIGSALNLDLINNDPELTYNAPATVLKKILELVGLTYRKHKSEVNTVVNNIDFDYLFSCNGKISSFFKFVGAVDHCGLLPNIL
jgi:hypothetical protein